MTRNFVNIYFDQVSWHLTFPASEKPDVDDLHLSQYTAVNCSLDAEKNLEQIMVNLEPRLADELALKRASHQLPYPQNLLRNLARQHCLSEWVMCPDVDMVFPRPDGNLTQSLVRFLQTSKALYCSKCAFVFPLYEVCVRQLIVRLL